MLTKTPKGLYCPDGNFYIDPMGAVDNAVVTHAHSDHARRGSRQYFCAASGAELLRVRLGKSIALRPIEFGQPFQLGRVRLSFHPAGHILGSAQVRMECDGRVWVASGDYKREPDPTCEPFESVPCDVFVTEATFGTPSYRWKKEANVAQEIFDWWTENRRDGINSVLFAYSLGKAQRVLGLLAPLAQEPVYIDPTMEALTECYRARGIRLAETRSLAEVGGALKGALVLAPQSMLRTERAIVLGQNYKTAFASGWMADSEYGYDRGFLLSDHADWDDLLRTIQETHARKVYVQHRGNGALVRHLKSLGIEAQSEDALKFSAPLTEQMALPW